MTTPAAARTHTAATTMDRTQILAVMSELKLFGMRSAYDEIIKTAVKRSHEPQKLVGDLLEAEIAEKQARSIKYQMTIAKLPLAKDIRRLWRHDRPRIKHMAASPRTSPATSRGTSWVIVQSASISPFSATTLLASSMTDGHTQSRSASG